MKFDELSTKNQASIPVGHPAHYLESVIKEKVLPKQDKHDQEHEDMLRSWGHTNLKANQLTFRYDENGEIYTDRFWHIALHLLYWKQNNINMEYVNDFEQRFYQLEETPLPKINNKSELPDY